MADRTNRLVHEKSPYLQQHALNPVAWWPWCDDAFLEARRLDRPVFLSIGYSSCHWCHVMEKESFEDPEAAQSLNNAFVCIKVDKEERPDIDHLYMDVCQAFTGSGGWPLSLLLTWDKRPFFAATYIPKNAGVGRLGLIELTQRVCELWKNERESLIAPAKGVLEAIEKGPEAKSKRPLGQQLLDSAYFALEHAFDAEFGGFGQAPKFPSPTSLLFLLQYHFRTGRKEPLLMAIQSLKKMRFGGIYDHLGFGFHRYATDRAWRVPHFEKMLYDQALLSYAYTEAYSVSKDPLFARTAQETFSYVISCLTSEEGAFFSSQDADSEGEEGKYYLVNASELESRLSPREAAFNKEVFGIEEEGNFLDPVSQERTGKNILAFRKPPDVLAKSLGLSHGAFWETVEASRQKLLAFRNRRTPPATDEKILLDWNALMIAALAKGSRVLGDESLLKQAQAATRFLWEKMRGPDGEFFHAFKDRPIATGFLDDYAFFSWALLEVYESSFEVAYLKKAKDVADRMLNAFFDSSSATFSFCPKGFKDLPVRTRRLEDSALPSGSSMAITALLKLSMALAEPEYERLAKEALKGAAAWVELAPYAFASFLCALDHALGPSSEVILAVNDPSSKEAEAFLRTLWSTYLPRTIVLLRPTTTGLLDHDIATLTPFRKGLATISEKPTAYLCQGMHCEPATHDIQPLIDRIRSRPSP